MKFLVLENDAIKRKQIKRFIESIDGNSCSCCKSESEISAAILIESFDVFVLNADQRGVNGFNLIPIWSQIKFTAILTSKLIESKSVFLNVADFYINAPTTETQINTLVKELSNRSVVPKSSDLVYLRDSTNWFSVTLSHILYIQAMEDYVEFNCKKSKGIQKIMIYSTMKKVEQFFVPLGFTRVHRSYIVANKYLKSKDHDMLVVEGIIIPLGLKFSVINQY